MHSKPVTGSVHRMGVSFSNREGFRWIENRIPARDDWDGKSGRKLLQTAANRMVVYRGAYRVLIHVPEYDIDEKCQANGE